MTDSWIHGGQRKGLGGSLAVAANSGPKYVLAIHPDSHRVTVGADEELLSRELRAERLNWISVAGLAEGEEMRVRVKIRHRHEPAWATLRASEQMRWLRCLMSRSGRLRRGSRRCFMTGMRWWGRVDCLVASC